MRHQTLLTKQAYSGVLFCCLASLFFPLSRPPPALRPQTKLLTQYVLNLAKYDQNYDIRDRARFIRQLIVPTDKCGALSKYAKKLILALKPAPILESPFKGEEHHNTASLWRMQR